MTSALLSEAAGLERFRTAFEALERETAGEPAWLRDRRRAAIAQVETAGFPGPREEAWRHTNVAPVIEAPLQLLPRGADRPALAALDRLPVLGREWLRLVFVDGRFVPALSDPGARPAGVQAGSLAVALRDGDAPIARALGRVGADAHAFAALNTAFFRDGAVVHVAAGAAPAPPVHVVYASATPGLVVQPRTLVLADAGAEVTVLEHHVGAGADPGWTNAVTDVVADDGATVTLCRLVDDGAAPYHLATTRVRQGRDSTVRAAAMTLGGALVRLELDVAFGAPGGTCRLDGLYLAGDRQHVDHYVHIDHAVPHCTSEQLFKGILDGRSRAAFTGHILVRRGAQKSDATQTNKHLLLADGPEVYSRPWLEIFADDVRCTHGAAEGQLAQEAVFYLKSRGLSDIAARRLLTYGFAREVLERLPVDALRLHLDRLVRARLGEESAFALETSP